MIISEDSLRSVVRSVIEENYGHQSHKKDLIKKFQKEENRAYWNKNLRSDFYDMSVGDSVANELKSTYYPRWKLQDFIDVIIAIDGSYDY